MNKHTIPTQHMGSIDIELVSHNQETGYTQFEITFNAFTKTKILLTGATINSICDVVNGPLSRFKKEK